MSLDLIPDHVDLACARLLSQVREKDSHRGLIASFVTPTQDTENTLQAVRVLRDLDTATGAQLDEIGRLVGVQREGRADLVYRDRVRVQILINRSSGEAETLRQIVAYTLPTATAIHVTDTGNASATITTEGVVHTSAPLSLAVLLRDAKAAGVRVILHYQLSDDTLAFTFATGPGLGFSATGSPATGGRLVGAIT